MRIPAGSVPISSATAAEMAAISAWRLGITLAAGAAGTAAGAAAGAAGSFFPSLVQTALIRELRMMMQIRPKKTVPIPMTTTKVFGIAVLSSFKSSYAEAAKPPPRLAGEQVKMLTCTACAKIPKL